MPYASPGYPPLLFSMRLSAPIYDFMRIERILLQRFRRDIAFFVLMCSKSHIIDALTAINTYLHRDLPIVFLSFNGTLTLVD